MTRWFWRLFCMTIVFRHGNTTENDERALKCDLSNGKTNNAYCESAEENGRKYGKAVYNEVISDLMRQFESTGDDVKIVFGFETGNEKSKPGTRNPVDPKVSPTPTTLKQLSTTRKTTTTTGKVPVSSTTTTIKHVQSTNATAATTTMEKTSAFETTKTLASTSTASTASSTPATKQGWIKTANGYQYRVFTNATNYKDANRSCANEGGRLASSEIENSQSELERVYNASRLDPFGTKLKYKVWVGMDDLENEGDWVWSDGKNGANSTMWDNKEPDGGLNENCASMSLWQIHDAVCNTNRSYLCEIPPNT